jgi:MoaA/NifB/PqqE/SkfB family radical SAM enzyme
MIDKKKLLESKHFCILPFIHACIWTDGRVLPCCINQHHILGNVKSTKIEDIYSNDNKKLVQIRQEMIEGPHLPMSCRRCQNMETNYADNSYRYYSNRNYGYLLDHIDIHEDGTVTENKISTWDVRFSNLCNLKCRTCDDINSSKIAEESRKHSNKDVIVLKEAFDDKEMFLDFFKKNIDNITEIYFCGGEPLLLEEHYEMLDLLVERGKFDTILRYNTNCTKLTFRDKNVLDYWSKFKDLRLGLSIDAGWEQLYYIRHGAQWDTVVDNIKQIVTACPHAFVQLSPTIGILNAFHIERMHFYLVEQGLIQLNNVFFNILTHPTYYSMSSLPQDLKEQARIYWESYKQRAIEMGANDFLIEEISKVIRYMDIGDLSSHLNDFKIETQNKDKIRRENFVEVFPELKTLLL